MRGEKVGEVTRSVTVAHARKRGAKVSPKLPPTVGALKQWLDRADTTGLRDPPLARAKQRAKERALDAFCFLACHGMSGLHRWATNKLLPHHWIRRWAMGDRANLLYRASRDRRAVRSRQPSGFLWVGPCTRITDRCNQNMTDCKANMTGCGTPMTGTVVGYDPGGNGNHGFACAKIRNGNIVGPVATKTLPTAEDVVRSILGGEKPLGIGVDTLTCWSTGHAGWRPRIGG